MDLHNATWIFRGFPKQIVEVQATDDTQFLYVMSFTDVDKRHSHSIGFHDEHSSSMQASSFSGTE